MDIDTLNQEIVVPDIHLQGIGEKENGILAQDAAKQILSALMDGVQTEMLQAQAEGLIKGQFDSITDGASKSLGSKIKGLFK